MGRHFTFSIARLGSPLVRCGSYEKSGWNCLAVGQGRAGVHDGPGRAFGGVCAGGGAFSFQPRCPHIIHIEPPPCVQLKDAVAKLDADLKEVSHRHVFTPSRDHAAVITHRHVLTHRRHVTTPPSCDHNRHATSDLPRGGSITGESPAHRSEWLVRISRRIR